MKLNTFELVGIGASISIMALALWLVRVETTTETLANLGVGNTAAVVVADDVGNRVALEAAFDEAFTGNTLSRLVIDDVRVGTGPAVVEGDTVAVNYIGTLQNGVQFDNSYERGEAFTFTVGDGRVIAGWEQGLLGMQAGGQRVLVIPSELGYGNRAVGPIPADSTLIFAIELLSIE